MDPRTLFAPVVQRLRRGGRRVWQVGERAHVQLSDQVLVAAQECATQVETVVKKLPGVRWAKVHPSFGRLIVEHEKEKISLEDILKIIQDEERSLSPGHHDYTAESPEHVGELEPLARTTFELAADLCAIGVGGALRLLRVGRPAIEVDIAALLVLVDGIPELRASLERRFGRVTVELGFGLANALNQALLRAWAGLLASALQRYLHIRELRAQRALWLDMESSVFARPEHFPQPRRNHAASALPVPEGPIEKYSEKAVAATLGGFGLGLTSTRSAVDASAAVFGGIPRAAQVGREAFAAELGFRLAQEKVMVRDTQALRRLDRIGCVIVDDAFLRKAADGGAEPAAGAREFVEMVHAQKLRLVILTPNPADFGWAKAHQSIPPGFLRSTIRSMQRRNLGVCLMLAEAVADYDTADVSLAWLKSDTPLPFDAHCYSPHGLETAILLLHMIKMARVVARQGVQLAVLQACASGVVALSGLESHTTKRIMRLGNVATFVAIANGLRVAGLVASQPRIYDEDAINWHSMTVDEVLRAVDSDMKGLSPAQAALRKPPAPKQKHGAWRLWTMLLEELSNPLTPILALGATLSALVGSVTDSALVVAVVLLNAVIGAAQRLRVEGLLKEMDRTERRQIRARRRSAGVVEVDISDLVVGDIVELESAETVPADCRIVEAEGLSVDESNLTGESLPVNKSAEPNDSVFVAERSSMLFAGTHIASGTAVAVVVAIGTDTQMGRAESLVGARPHAGGVEERLDDLTRMTAPAAAMSAVALGGLGALRAQPAQEVVSTAVGLAVAAVPEGLPMLATIAQLAAASRLSSHGALVRNPRAIEALGRVNVVCADKTGTLTEGTIRLDSIADISSHHKVSEATPQLRSILAAGMRASPEGNGRLPHLTDLALVTGAQDHEIKVTDDYSGWQRLEELPFESVRGYHAVLGQHQGGLLLSAKGAPEVLLPRCSAFVDEHGDQTSLDETLRDAMMQRSSLLAQQGLRILVVAERAADKTSLEDEDIENFVFRGFVAFADPVRTTARKAVADLRAAGVQMVMITGDHPSTARSIARELALPNNRNIITGAELDELSEEELAKRLPTTAVFARVTPSQKVRIVQQLKKAGSVVAMAGDGANDAAAIRLADAGIALGEGSTAAARHAADVIVADEKIETLVQAVLEGRALWSTVRDAVALLVGGNLGEIAFTVLGSLFSRESPLNTRQLLLVNLLTDVLPAIAIAVQPPEKTSPEELLEEGPEASLGFSLNRAIAWRAGLTTLATSCGWFGARIFGTGAGSRTVALVSLVGAQLIQTVFTGSHSRLVWLSCLGSAGVLLAAVQTPGVSQFFGCRPLGPFGFTLAMGAASTAGLGAVLGPRVWPVLKHSIGEERLARVSEQPWIRKIINGGWMQQAA